MTSERVVATESAKNAAATLAAMTDSLSAEIQRLRQIGDLLCRPAVWDSRQASEFRSQQWPQARRVMDAELRSLEKLGKFAKGAIANILHAGNDGGSGAGVAREWGLKSVHDIFRPMTREEWRRVVQTDPWRAFTYTMQPDDRTWLERARDWVEHTALPFVEKMGKAALDFGVDTVKGAAEGTWSLVKTAWTLTPGLGGITDPKGFVQAWEGVGHLGLTLVAGTDQQKLDAVTQIGKAVFDWKDIADGHPGKAVGRLLPTVLLATATGGAGAAAEGGTAAAGATAGETAGGWAETLEQLDKVHSVLDGVTTVREASDSGDQHGG